MDSPRHRARHIDMHVGQRLRILRMQRDMSQQELGRYLSMSFQQIQKYERGMNRIAAGTLYNLARTLKFPINVFFDGLSEESASESAGPVAENSRIAVPNLTHEAMTLARAFSNIKNPTVRSRLIKFVVAIIEDSEK